MKNEEIIVYVVSDSIGETAQKVLSATVAQFPGVAVKEVKRFPFVDSVDAIKEILKEALEEDAIVIATLVNPLLVKEATDYCLENKLAFVDLMSPLTKMLSEKTGVLPAKEPGALHRLNKEYFSRIEAMEFAVRYDDGKEPRGFKEADFILVGLSRTSKTPLSIYLANKGYKVANLPLIPNVPIPREIYEVPSEKLVGLTTNIESLLAIRRTRLQSFGLKEETSYADATRIKEELLYAEHVFLELGIEPINVDNRAIEETAMLIEMKEKRFL